ncbi:MAG TPA: secondary thiamine-phosphate synthase enzyme YjbQ [archaeon]|nr:secondary thiamine-phosphate synthase enzyme YjbQ [archaeon]
MKVYNEFFTISTNGGIDFIDITDKIQKIVTKSGVKNGLIHVFAPHATGVIVLTENEPNLQSDIEQTLNKLIPRHASYRHPDNAQAHLLSMFLNSSKTIPIIDGQAAFGTWQSLIFIEVDMHPRQRRIIVQIIGE